MDFLEKDLEDIIYNASQTIEGRQKLGERGLELSGKMLRQVNLDIYGRLDLVSIELLKHICYRTVYINIYELKKDIISTDALLQGCRYITGVKDYIEKKYDTYNLDVDIKLTLVGRKIETSSDFPFLYNNLSFCDIYTYNYGIDGIEFNEVDKGWINTKFNYENIDTNIDYKFVKSIMF